jgi:nucleotide-binding universal stress UspA family protein
MINLKHVLVATDFSPPSRAALAYARALARTFGASLHVLHVAENSFLRPTPSDPHAIVAAKRRALHDLIADQDGASSAVRTVVEVSDDAADAIVAYARAEPIDLVVVGTHGRSGVAQLLVGSVAERVVRTAPCPVLTVRHPEHDFIVPDTTEQRGGHDRPQEDSRRN